MEKLDSLEVGEAIKESRLLHRLSQKELAKEIGISRSMLSKAEAGTRKLSQSNLETLFDFFHDLEGDEPLKGKIDYLSIHFSTLESEWVITEILGIANKHFEFHNSAPLGYDDRLSLLNVINLLRSHANREKGVLLELSGQGCTMLGGWLKSRKETWFDFFEKVFKYQGNFTRIDLALDDSVGVIDLDEIKKKIEREEFWSKFKVAEVISSKDISNNESNGTTIYFGSKKSLVHFCFYQKNYEQKRKKGIELDEAGIVNRYELRFRHEKADKLAKELMKHQDVEDVIYRLLNTHLCFYDRPKTEKDVEMDRNWKRLIGAARKISLPLDVKAVSYARSASWIINNVAPTLKFLSIVDTHLNARLLEQIIENAELNNRQKTLIEIIKDDPEPYKDQIRIFERSFFFKKEQKEKSKVHITEEIDSSDAYSALDKLSIPHSEKLLKNLGGFQQ